MPCDEGRADKLQGCLVSAPATSNASPRGEAAREQAEPAASDGDGGAGRPTVTRVTPTALELHKKKEQDRRAKEKHLFACLQTLLFQNREKAPTASEVTYNYVLECTVAELKSRARAAQSLGTVDAEAVTADVDDVSQTPAVRGETERHKVSMERGGGWEVAGRGETERHTVGS
jgi:hypothetical protein